MFLLFFLLSYKNQSLPISFILQQKYVYTSLTNTTPSPPLLTAKVHTQYQHLLLSSTSIIRLCHFTETNSPKCIRLVTTSLVTVHNTIHGHPIPQPRNSPFFFFLKHLTHLYIPFTWDHLWIFMPLSGLVILSLLFLQPLRCWCAPWV